MNQASQEVSREEALSVWTRVGLQSFGGPAGQIAVMHRILVEEKRWIDEPRFLHALNYCMLLPGPEAQQLATYLGWLLHGIRGGLVAGCLFILPGFASILALSYAYASLSDVGLVGALFFGLKAAVLAIVIQSVGRIGKRVLQNRTMFALAAAAFVAIFFFQAPFPAIVATAAVVGWLGGRIRPRDFVVIRPHAVEDAARRVELGRPSSRHAFAVLATMLVLWFGPVSALLVLLGPGHVFSLEAVFFSKTAVVTFGGAYAVLAYIAQQAVERYGWLQAGEMLDGLGMAETTPGPLIMVTQFVGFMGAYRNPGELDPWVAGTLGALVTTWVTFVPCFLWIFLGAPWVERLRGNTRLSAALSAVTAAVVGVVLNLGVWFGLHVVFGTVSAVDGPLGARLFVPEASSLDLSALAIVVFALVATFRYEVGMLRVLGASAALGIGLHALGWA